MNIRNFTNHLPAAIAMAAVLSFPCIAQAISIGEIDLRSKLGEPLYARVSIMAGSGEQIENGCLSLAAPDPSDDDADNYLTKAQLAIETEGAQQYVIIRSRAPFNELFAKLRLEVKCPGTGNVIKTMTILPDLDIAPPVEVSAPETLAVNAVAPMDKGQSPSDKVSRMPPAVELLPVTEKIVSAKAEQPAKKPHALTARKKTGQQPAFRLKLSGEPIDESRIGKISPEERESLLARQKLLDADDQMANFLALQHQVQQLHDELGEVKLKLAQLEGAPPSAAPSGTDVQATSLHAPEAKPAFAQKQPLEQQNYPVILRVLFAALALLAVILALWQGRRYYRSKSQRAAESTLAQPTKKVDDTPIPRREMPASPAQGDVSQPSAMTGVELPKKELASPPPSTVKNREELAEQDSMLEEAELYAVHGHPDKAIEILHEIVMQHPAHAEAWLLLLSILSSLGKGGEFEQSARDFLRHNKNSTSWKMIQALGRTLDQNNPLYAGDGNLGAAAMFLPQLALNKRRPVGDILVEMGALSSPQLQDCLASFDPKLHGRLGGYLITRKAITHAQLNEALLQQQVGEGGTAGGLPTLQDMENLVADFDPKRDGSIGEYLVARKAITPAQLDKVLQQQSKTNAAAPAPQSRDTLIAGEKQVLDFEFEPLTEKNKPLDFEVAPPTEKSKPLDFDLAPTIAHNQPLDFDVTPLFPAFPEIDLSPESIKQSIKKPAAE
jgi:hypothetical protein